MRTVERRQTARTSLLVRLVALAALILSSAAVTRSADAEEPPPTIASDKADYFPGSTVTLTGTGWGGDAGVHISVNDTLGKTWNREVDVPVAADGSITDSFELPTTFVAEYDVVATGMTTGRVATTTFTDASADLDQCANGALLTPESCNGDNATNAANWVNGQLGASKSHYFEGDSIPYRMKMDGLAVNSVNTVIFAWDVSKSSKHAIDFLTSYDRTVTDADPCVGVAGCGAETTFAIPMDPAIPGGIQETGDFSMFGGTITNAQYGFDPGSDSCPGGTPDYVGDDTRCITLTFTAATSNPVLAWGGHIATRKDWGSGNAAVNIPGSPFHTSFVALNGSGGNQDMALSSAAVIFPATITVIKHAEPAGSTQFPFTAGPAPLTDFSLTDDQAATDPSQSFTLDAPTEFTTYTVDEGVVPNFATTAIVCQVTDASGGSATINLPDGSVQIDIREGENRSCTFTNTLQTGTLTVVKHVVNDDGGDADAGDWSLHVTSGGNEVTGSPQAGSESGTVYNLVAGTYDVSETGGPTGYSFDGFSGDCNASGQVTVVAGQNKTCTLTNDDDVATLKLVKLVTNDDGGAAQPDDFTLFADADAPDDGRNFFNLGGSGVFEDVFAGVAYDLSETGPAGYTGGSWSCDGGTQNGASVELALGEDVTCTLTNADNTAQLKLVKVVENDDGGAAGPADFNLSATAAGNPLGRNFSSQTGSPDFHKVAAGAVYALSETGPLGYTGGAWSCTGGGTQVGSTIQLGLGEQVTCTITNTDDTPTLTLVKSVVNDDGGTADAGDWTLSATAAEPDHARNFSGPGDSGTPNPVFAGVAYDLTEAPNPGAGYSSTGEWSCPGGTMSNDNTTVTVPLGADVTCTITNDDVAPELKLVKVVTNDDGGSAGEDDFTLFAAADAPDNGRNFSNTGGSGMFEPVFAGVVYDLSESGPLGYTGGSWNCSGGTQVGDTIELEVGEQVTCTITNTDNTPRLKLVKVVDSDDGGTADEDDFTLFADADAPDDARNFFNAGGSGDFEDVFAGVVYDLSESGGPDGYTAGAWSCDGGNQVGDTIELGLGAEVTCAITNTDDAPQLTLVKDVENDDGGMADGGDWTLSATAVSPDDGRNFSDAGDSGLAHAVFAGVAYDLSEAPSSGTGYSSTGEWSCPDGTMSNGNTTVTLELGDDVTCTIVNTDDTPRLKLVKVVANDDGGTAVPDDWTLHADAVGGDSSRDLTTPGGSHDFEAVFAGTTYLLSETGGPDDYTASQWNCVGDGFQLGAMITLGLGDQVTCTITNSDDTPSLTLVKSVVNNDGGTADAGDWTLSATAAEPDDGRNFSGAGDSGIVHDVLAGVAYDLAEAGGPAGYSSTGQWSCPGGTMSNGNTTVTVDLGDEVTCTIVNTDNTPALKLVKVVSGGSATPAGFNLSAAAAGNPLGRNFSSQTASPAFHDVVAGATYTLSETGPAGYTASAWSCTGGGTQVGSTIELALGEQVTCTITNTRDLGNVSAVKYHDLDGDGTHENGGDPTLEGWTIFVDLDKNGSLDPGEPSGSTNGSGTVTFTGLETNVGGSTYWVCEVGQAGWVNSDPGNASVSNSAACESATVSKDATTTVRFGNYQRIGIEVDKTVDGGAVPSGVTFDFSIRENASTDPNGVNGGFGTLIATGSITGPDNTITSADWQVAGGEQYPLDPGTYQLCEAIEANYTPSWVQGAYGVDWFSPGIESGDGFQENENTLVCITFTVVSGDGGADHVVEFGVNNAPRGMSRTIGFWKNWTSCDGNGNQFPMLDTVLNGGTYDGITYPGADDSNGNGLKDIRIGNVFIEGPNACKIAVDLLDKRSVGNPAKVADSKKAAGDPVHNTTAQLVAFELNQLLNPLYSGSAACQTKAAAAAQLQQRFLMYIDFKLTSKDSTYKLPTNKTAAKDLQANLLYLANILDDYNNNTIAGCNDPLALPKPTVAGTNPLKLWTAVLPPAQDT